MYKKYIFSGHESFPCRMLWPIKGYDYIVEGNINPAKRNVLVWKNETCKNREKRNVLKFSRTRHTKAIKKQSKSGCFYCF